MSRAIFFNSLSSTIFVLIVVHITVSDARMSACSEERESLSLFIYDVLKRNGNSSKAFAMRNNRYADNN